ncbi:MAG TPA: cupredoxin domain-containing protein [Pyrinomonadaceae bacterium]|nr:cupredoxin domain-containing protein [Pyrinomonadaceae bacterium]
MKYTALLIFASAILIAGCSRTKSTGSSADPDVYVAKAGETVRITVSTSYSPQSVKVNNGETVKLEFTRVDDQNCGDELVFPKLGIKKVLPVGQPVAVEITPNESGDLQFNCGMEMMKGKIIVE